MKYEPIIDTHLKNQYFIPVNRSHGHVRHVHLAEHYKAPDIREFLWYCWHAARPGSLWRVIDVFPS